MDDYIVYSLLAALAGALFAGIALGRKLEHYRLRASHQQELADKEREFQEKEKESRKDAVERSKRVLIGKGAEQLVPLLPGFAYEPTDVRFLGSPLDLLVFRGNTVGEPLELVLVEVKTGKSTLSTNERKWRDVINEGKVRWELLRL